MSIDSMYGKKLTIKPGIGGVPSEVRIRLNPEPRQEERGVEPLEGRFKRAELIAELKAVGFTAEDFREPTFQEEFDKLENNTVFQMVDPVAASADKPLFLKEDANYLRKIKTGERFDSAPVSKRYGIKVISKPVEN